MLRHGTCTRCLGQQGRIGSRRQVNGCGQCFPDCRHVLLHMVEQHPDILEQGLESKGLEDRRSLCAYHKIGALPQGKVWTARRSHHIPVLEVPESPPEGGYRVYPGHEPNLRLTVWPADRVEREIWIIQIFP